MLNRKWGLYGLVGLLVGVLLTGCMSSQRDSTGANASGSSVSGAAASMDRAAASAPLPPPSRYYRNEYDAMYFESFETNPFIATEDDALSTFAAEVDTGSYTVVRNYIQRGALPPKEAFRVEEFINSFALDVPPPGPGEGAFRVLVEGGPSPFGEGYELLRITLKGREVEPEARKPANLVFVIDTSGSMERENRLGLVQQSLRLLVNALNEDDRIGIVTYGTEARTVLKPTSLGRKEAILKAIDGLRAEGSTNVEEGLELGYEMAARMYDEEAINRVILLSDGVANVGKTEAEDILKDVEDYTAQGITLTTVGVGMGNYNDVLMEQLADRGNGVYAYVDGISEARKLFLEQLTGTLQTIARDVKIQVAFDPEKVDRYRLLGYENRDMPDEDFERDDADAGEIGAGHVVTALYEIKRVDDAQGTLGEVRVRYVDEDTRRAEEIAAPLVIDGDLGRETSFLAAVAEYAEIMRGSFWARGGSLDDVLALAESSAQGEDQQLFVGMVKDTIAIRKAQE